MNGNTSRPRIFLCAGLQASGSTICSWCFLQRPDLDGILDGRFDEIPQIPQIAAGTMPWLKFTIVSFRLTHVVQHYQDQGFDVTPLLVARDLRSVFNSLLDKPKIARNGTTAEQPPLRLCMRRFLEDWQHFRENNWPILRYESFLREPENVLRQLCEQMNLPWDSAMITWPKSREQIADARWGSRTLRATMQKGGGLRESLISTKNKIKTDRILPGDFHWLEEEFAEFNRQMDYPLHVPYTPPPGTGSPDWWIPSYSRTSRHERELKRQRPLRRTIRGVARFFERLAKPFRKGV